MDRYVIEGGVPLRGEVRVAGAKNAVLKEMAAAILTDEPVMLRNVPRISDVAIMRETMADIGFAWIDVDEHTIELRDRGPEWLFVPLEAAMKMRSSFILLGPLLVRHGRRNARLQDARLLERDLGDRAAQPVGVVERHGGDGAGERRQDVRGVVATSHADLADGDRDASAAEVEEGQGRRRKRGAAQENP